MSRGLSDALCGNCYYFLNRGNGRRAVLRYVERKPVRAAPVECAQNWCWSSAASAQLAAACQRAADRGGSGVLARIAASDPAVWRHGLDSADRRAHGSGSLPVATRPSPQGTSARRRAGRYRRRDRLMYLVAFCLPIVMVQSLYEPIVERVGGSK